MTAGIEMTGTRYEIVVKEAMADYGTLARYAAGDRIFTEGEPSEKLCMLVAGEVAIEIQIPGYAPVKIAKVVPGELFGWSAVLAPRRQRSTARVVEPSEVLWVSGEKMRDLAAEDSHFGFDLYRFTSELVAKRLYAARAELAELLAGIPA